MSTCRTVQPVSSGGSALGAGRRGELAAAHRRTPAAVDARRRCRAARAVSRGGRRRADHCRGSAGTRVPGPVTSSSSSSASAARSASESMREAGTRWPRMLVPRTRTSVKPASASSVSSWSTSKRRGSGSVLPQRPDGSTSAARAWPNSPAMALAKTTASRPETSSERMPPSGRRAAAMARSVAAGSSTNSSVPWQQTRSTLTSGEHGAEGVAVALDAGDVVDDAGLAGPAARAPRARRGWGRRR